jgi:hypothetical protein
MFWQTRIVEVIPGAKIDVFRHRPDDGGSEGLWNVGKLLPIYTALQPRSRHLHTRHRENIKSHLRWYLSRGHACWTMYRINLLFEVSVPTQSMLTMGLLFPGFACYLVIWSVKLPRTAFHSLQHGDFKPLKAEPARFFEKVEPKQRTALQNNTESHNWNSHHHENLILNKWCM